MRFNMPTGATTMPTNFSSQTYIPYNLGALSAMSNQQLEVRSTTSLCRCRGFLTQIVDNVSLKYLYNFNNLEVWGGFLHVALLEFNCMYINLYLGRFVRILEHQLHSLQTLITTFESVTSSSLYGRKFTWVFSILMLKVWKPVDTKLGFYKCCLQIARFIHVVPLLCAEIQMGGSLDSLTCANWEQKGNGSLGMYKRKIKKVGEEMCLLFLCFIPDGCGVFSGPH